MKNTKHAYLILAHHEFEVLAYLISALDDVRNDIYIHFDKKIRQLPHIKVFNARLFVIEDRIDVRWGDISQIESEFLLFETAASNGSYQYYHLLSGVDMPLKSQDEIHEFFDQYQGKEFIGFNKMVSFREIERKVMRYHLFPQHFRSTSTLLNIFRRSVRFIALRIQFVFGIRRNKSIEFKKGTSWVSVSHAFVSYLLKMKVNVLKTYRYTFCGDEIFLHTICWNSPFKEQVFDITDEEQGGQRLIGWEDGKLFDWQESDFDKLMQSSLLFARKFNGRHLNLVHRIFQNISG